MTEQKNISNKNSLDGTVICSVITREKIYLFSDGRVHDHGRITSDEHSKVHMITKYAGMLTAGRYLEIFAPTLIKECKVQKLTFVDDVVQNTNSLLQRIWNHNEELMEKWEEEDNSKIAILVVGYSKDKTPKLYYLDSTSRPRFEIKERLLFKGKNNIEISVIASASDENTQDATTLMVNHINILTNATKKDTIENVLFNAFKATVKEMSSENPFIGGKAFLGIIDPISGFQWRHQK